MYHCLGTTAECTALEGKIPITVLGEVVRGLAVLESDYGTDRNIFESGGYSLIVHTASDLEQARDLFDDRTHSCEWATTLGDSGFCSALYLLTDDFSVMLYIPIELANPDILENLEP